ncbi:NUDIX hydrolase [Streptomonospora litoralis]|uniref:Nudix hydrolase domain-containing protein n=1 Tax=Streptomonospora litoralis TaxID=2498135 RepID=A0A4P6QAA1_9ACTN|nr:NUDIX domain-containing protein [Streptomonospora litoralis]QBI56137.1 hypothetical protein EKD16_21920 [Streptomonospora litoralis]
MCDRMFENLASEEARSAAVLAAHVLLFDRGRVLLTRRSANAAYAPLYWHASVAGKVEPHESVVDAAVREAREELGIVLAPGDLEPAHVMHSAENGSRLHVFFAARTWEGVPVNAEPDKHAQIAWNPAHRLPDATVGYCAQAIEAYLTGAPFSLHRFPHNGETAAASGPAAEADLGDAGVPGSLELMFNRIAAERRRQERMYGIQNLSSGNGPQHRPQAERAQSNVDDAGHPPTFYDLAFEELSEARAADDRELLEELVQSAAVLVQWGQAVLASQEAGDPTTPSSRS